MGTDPRARSSRRGRAGQDLPSYCRSTRTSRKGNTEPRRLVTEPGATMSEGAAGRRDQSAGPTRPRWRSAAAAPARRRLSLRPRRQLEPTRGRQRGAGPGRRSAPRAAAVQSPSAYPLFYWARPVVVRADRLRRPSPRPISDRVTWKHETRLRPPVAELSEPSDRPQGEGGRESDWQPPSPHAQGAKGFWIGPACCVSAEEEEDVSQATFFRGAVWRGR